MSRAGSESQALAEQVRWWRRNADISQEELAESMRNAGLPTWSRATVSEMERGNRAITVDEATALADALFGPTQGVISRCPPLTSFRTKTKGRWRPPSTKN